MTRRPHWSSFVRGTRKARGQMNKLERAYAEQLELCRRLDEEDPRHVAWWQYEAIKLKITEVDKAAGKNNYFTPDFVVMRRDMILTMIEIKGVPDPVTMLRLRMAATMFPFRFVLATRKNGVWRDQQVSHDEKEATEEKLLWD